MGLWSIRIFFVILSAIVGYQLGQVIPGMWPWAGGAVGGGIAGILIGMEYSLKKVSTRGLSAAVFGLLFGLVMARLILSTLDLVPVGPELGTPIRSILVVVFSYFGMAIALRGRDEFNIIIPYVKFTRQDQREEMIILDTSVVIDGRIADICVTRF